MMNEDEEKTDQALLVRPSAFVLPPSYFPFTVPGDLRKRVPRAEPRSR